MAFVKSNDCNELDASVINHGSAAGPSVQAALPPRFSTEVRVKSCSGDIVRLSSDSWAPSTLAGEVAAGRGARGAGDAP